LIPSELEGPPLVPPLFLASIVLASCLQWRGDKTGLELAWQNQEGIK